MKKTILFVLIFIGVVYSQDMRKNSFVSLFSDQKAAYVGDAITIIVMESSLATNKAETNSGKKSDLGFNLTGEVNSKAIPNVDVGINSNNDFTGSGSTKSSGLIQTKISATIDSEIFV